MEKRINPIDALLWIIIIIIIIIATYTLIIQNNQQSVVVEKRIEVYNQQECNQTRVYILVIKNGDKYIEQEVDMQEYYKVNIGTS